jgi:haloalkane dehalogenase
MTTNSIPDWLDKNKYPFKSNYIEIDGHQLHYIDEGKGQVLLMVHGIPDWSFSYRHLIKDLSKNYRCIALDNLGYGLSDKPEDADYSHPAHARRLEEFIEKLGLKNINLLLHDFGGPMGIYYAKNNPENVNKIIVGNSWIWGLDKDKHFTTGDKLINSWFGKFLYLNMNFSVNFMMKQSFANKSILTKAIHNQFKKAQDKAARKANYRLAKDLVGAHNWHNSIYNKREKLLGKPLLLIWGMKDKFFPADTMIPKWQAAFPQAKLVKLENAGHFFQEEAPLQVSQAIKEFLE